ncbi:dCMP deaminase [Rhodotorula toruloides]|uniref:dCMP deaminase n=1 Tax=Rhodotorula toruloides TaxID=5286 RepID=A0A511K8Y1_RHOTO|nr:dCMP deaminase [Rhodotorula toruloides]
MPKKRVKKEQDEDQDADLSGEDEPDGEADEFPDLVDAMGDVGRPNELATDANLLRAASLSTFDVAGEDTRELTELGMFARRDLGGNEQNTTDKTQKRIVKWGTMRNAGGQAATSAVAVPAKPPSLVDAASDHSLLTAYGIYRYHWCGLANEGKFDRLTEREKDQVVDVFCSYLRGGRNKFVEWLFRDVKVQLDPNSPVLSGLWATRKTTRVKPLVRRTQQRLAIRGALSQNNVLPQGWAIMVYDGPLPADELDFVK